MPSRLAHITNHFFDLPSQDATNTATAAGSPHPNADLPASLSLYMGSPRSRHAGGRGPASAAVAAALRRGNNTNMSASSAVGGGAHASYYGRPTSPSSSSALTPPQSPAFPAGSPRVGWPATVGSPSMGGQAAVPGASSPLFPAGRASRYVEVSESGSRNASPSSPVYRLTPGPRLEEGGAAAGFPSFPHIPSSSPRAGLRVSGASSRYAAFPVSGLPSPTRVGGGQQGTGAFPVQPASTTSGSPGPSPACDPTSSQYTEADAELLLHPLLHYVEDENVLRYGAGRLRRRRTEEVSRAVSGTGSASCNHAVPSAAGHHHLALLQRDLVLHARCSRMLAAMGVTAGAAQPMTRARAAGDAAGRTQRRSVALGGAGGGPTSADSFSRRNSDLRTTPPRVHAWGSLDGATVPRPHGTTPADSLTSASRAAASLYLLEMTGQLSNESDEQLHTGGSSAGAAANAGAASPTGAEAGSSRAEGASSSSPSPTAFASGGGRRRRSGSRVPLNGASSAASSSYDTIASAAAATAEGGAGDRSRRRSSTTAADPEGNNVDEGVLDEGEASLVFSHNVYCNYRTLPLQRAQRSYELLPARYRAGLDAISAEVLAQQQRQQQHQTGGGGAAAAAAATAGFDGVGCATAANNAGGSGSPAGGGAATTASGSGSGSGAHGSHGRRLDGATAAAATAAFGYGDVSYIGVSYLDAHGGVLAGPGASAYATASSSTAPNSMAPSPHPGAMPRAAPFGEMSGVWPGLRSDGVPNALPLPSSRAAAEERGLPAEDDAAAASTTNTNATTGPAPGSPFTPALAAGSALTTSPNTANSTTGTSLLHHVHHTIQSFVARGEKEVALHYIIAIAPYRFAHLSHSDRVLALFNQIRSFLPSPRFSTVLMAMEAWRCLYRPSVGASPTDYAHMTQELLSLIETYLCHGRTYAEYVSGLLMLRVVLGVAMAEGGLGGRNGAAVLLQHRALVQERLPTLLLAVWVTLMDYHTIDDLREPPRRVLRDLAAAAMQDLFTVALEAQMFVTVQNVVANAINVFFHGPLPAPVLAAPSPAKAAAAAAAAATVSRSGRGAEDGPSSLPLTAVTTQSAATMRHAMPTLQPRRKQSPPLAESNSAGGGGAVAAQVQARSPSSPTPPPPLARPAAVATTAAGPAATANTSESPAPTAPTTRTSYRALTKSVWRSVKQAARRLVSSAEAPARVGTTTATATMSRHGTSAAASQTRQGGVGGRLSAVPGVGDAAAPASSSFPTATPASAARRSIAAHHSPPLLIEVPDDVLLDLQGDPTGDFMATASMPGWAAGSLSVGPANALLAPSSLSASPHHQRRRLSRVPPSTPDLLSSTVVSSSRRDAMPHSPILPTAPNSSAVFHALWQPPLLPSSPHRAFSAARQARSGAGATLATAAASANASMDWADALWDAAPTGVGREALWAMPLAPGLRAAGRPLTLEATVAAASLTIGAFLCAWRIAGDEDGDESGTAPLPSPYSRLILPAPAADPAAAPTRTTSASPASGPAEATPAAPPRWRRDSAEPANLTASSTLTYYGASITSSPGCRDTHEGASVVLPLVSEEEVLAAVAGVSAEGRSDSVTNPASPISAHDALGGAAWGEASVAPGVNASMLSVSLAALAAMKPTAATYLDAAEALAEADPEWHSLEETARNVYIPPAADVVPITRTPVAGGAGNGGALDRFSPLEDAEAGTPSRADSAAAARAAPAATEPPLPSSLSSGNSISVPSLQTLAGAAAETATNCGGDGGGGAQCAKNAATGHPAPRSASPAAGTDAATAAPVSPAAVPPLAFFLPAWTVRRLVDKCLHPVWDGVVSAASVPAPTEDFLHPVSTRTATTETSASTASAAPPVAANVESEAALASLLPLLSQYYGDAFSNVQLTAATQLLVNRATKVMRLISQAIHRSTDDATVTGALFAASATSPPSAAQPSPLGFTAAGAEDSGAGEAARRCSVVETGALLPNCTYGLSHDSAKLDGTELLSAVLFACTLAERHPALYEAIVRHKLYPLLHHAMRLMAFEEEPRFWLATPFPSTAAWTAATPTVVGPAAGAAATAVGQQVYAQWMMLTAARSMFQRTAMPALLLLAHNMPTLACARQCAPLVDRLVQVGLRQPFSLANLTSASSICAVYPSMERACQAEVSRAMSAVLSTADDTVEETGSGAGRTSAEADDEAAGAGAGAAARARRPTRTPLQLPRTATTTTTASAATASQQSHAARSPTDGTAAGRDTPTAATKPGRKPQRSLHLGSSFVLPQPPTQLPRRRASAAALYQARCRRAAQVRLLKHHIFRSICLFPSSWEGTTLFFLEFCLPYLRHPDAQLRLECVQACTKWPLSDCWHSVGQTVPHSTATPLGGSGDAVSSLSSPVAGGGGGTSLLRPAANIVGSTSSLAAASGSIASPAHAAATRRATVSAAVTRVPVRDARSEDSHLGQGDAATSPCYLAVAPCAAAGSQGSAAAAANAAATASFAGGSLSAARAVGGVKRGQTLSAAASIARSGAGLPTRDSSGLLGANAAHGGAVGAGPATQPPSAAFPQGDGVFSLSAAANAGSAATAGATAATAARPVAAAHTVQHHGRTHINALREIVHHLVEIAVCDPEPLIRRCALESLTPETYQLLYPHETVLHQLFIVLWDSYLPNRVQAAQLLCALAPLNPPLIYPRLREVMVRYIADLTSSAQSANQRDGRLRRAWDASFVPVAAAAGAVGLFSMPCGAVPEDSLYVLSHLASRLKQSTPLYLSQLLSIVYSVLRSRTSGRGSVLQAMHLLIFLRDDSTQEQSPLFDPFVDLIADQLADGEGDTPRVLAAVAALQTLLQSAEPSQCSPQSLPLMVECLHSLLYRKPSVGTEFSMAVLQLLGTISNMEPWQPEMPPQAPALLRRPQNRYAIPLLSSLAGVLGKSSAMRSMWPMRAEVADNAQQALGQLQKADRFAPFTSSVWPDTVLRALLRTASSYMNGTKSLTQDGLSECLLAIMNILTNTMAVHHLDLYLPGVLTLVIDLLEGRDAHPLQNRTRPSPFFMSAKPADKGEALRRGTSEQEREVGWRTASQGGVRGRVHGALSEHLWLLFLRSLFDLVLMAGRRIAPMYPLLNVFLRRSWQQTTMRGIVHCCEVLDALCWSVPDLLHADCDTWITMLLSALVQYDAVVLTHRRAHEAAGATSATATPTTKTGTGANGAATAAGRETGVRRGAAAAAGLSGDTRRSAPASPEMGGSAETAAASPASPYTPNSGAPSPAGRENEMANAAFEEELKLVYRALTMCLTSLQPISSQLMRLLAAMSLSECLKSSYVPQAAGRHTQVAPAVAAAATGTHTRQPTTEAGVAEGGATSASFHDTHQRTTSTAAAHVAGGGVFDLMADPHEELISFINTCVCGPLMEYMVHSQLDTVSMKITKNILTRLESLSVVHEEALRRAADGDCSSDAADVSSAAESSRGQREAALRDARERLYARRLRQADEPAWGTSASAGARTPTAGAASSPSNALPTRSGSTPPTVLPLRARAAQEAVWFSTAPLSRMWVESADSAATVRRYFPFEAVQTSWETEGEMHLLSCLFAAAAWRHPASTLPFRPVLYAYTAQRFGAESLAMAYVRCVCSSDYDLRTPLLSMSEDEAAAVNWVYQAQQQQQQQREQQHQQASTEDADAGNRGDAAAVRFASRAGTVQRAAEQDTDTSGGGWETAREGMADVILRRPSASREASPGGLDGLPSTASTGQLPIAGFATSTTPAAATTVTATGTAGAGAGGAAATAAFNASSTGSRTGSWEAEGGPLRTVVTAEGELSSITSLSRTTALRPPLRRGDAAAGGGGGGASAADFFAAPSPVGSEEIVSCGGGGGASADWSDGAVVGGQRVPTGAAHFHYYGSEGEASSDTLRAVFHSAVQPRQPPPPPPSHVAYPSFASHHLSIPQQPTIAQPPGTSVASSSTTTVAGANSTSRTVTAAATETGLHVAHSPSTRSGPSTRDQSPSALTLPTPFRSHDVGATGPIRVGASAPVAVSYPVASSGGGGGAPALSSSFYPGSFFSSSIGELTGGSGGHPYQTSGSGHSGDGHGLRSAAAAAAAVRVGGGGGGSGSDPASLRPAAASVRGPHLPFLVPYSAGLHLPPPRPPSNSDLTTSSPLSTNTTAAAAAAGGAATSATGVLALHPPAMLTVGSLGAAASLGRRRSLLARPNSLFSGASPATSGNGVGSGAAAVLSSRSTLAGSGTGNSPLWHPPPIPVVVSGDDLTGAPSSVSTPHATAAGGIGADSSHNSPLQPHPRHRMSPLLPHPPLHRRPVTAGVMTSVAAAVGEEAGLLTAGASSDGVRQRSPLDLPSASAAMTIGSSIPGTPVRVGAASTTSTSSTAVRGVPAAVLPLNVQGQPLMPLPPAAASASGDPASPPSSLTDAANAVPTEVGGDGAGGATHRNSLILFFESHRLLRGHGWRSWWEQFSLFLVECSQDYCVKACEVFARHHDVAFAYTELLPLALLSTLPSCTVAELIAWLQALRGFYAFHSEPGNSVPLQVTSGVARLAHELRLHRSTFFPPEIVAKVIDVWLPDSVVADLAHHSLNPPLGILYLEQDLSRRFTWSRTALLVSATDDVASSLERKLFVRDARFQQWLRAAGADGSSAQQSAPLSIADTLGKRRSRGGDGEDDVPSSCVDALPPSALELLGFYRAAALEYVRLYTEQQHQQPTRSTAAGVGESGAGEQQLQQRRQRRRRGVHDSPTTAEERRGVRAADATAATTPTAAAALCAAPSHALTPVKCITGAMRCYLCLYDFAAVLRLWEVVRSPQHSPLRSTANLADAGEPNTTTAVAAAAEKTSRWGVETARYVALSAQALSRWDYVAETARYLRGDHGPWSDGLLAPVLERFAPSASTAATWPVAESPLSGGMRGAARGASQGGARWAGEGMRSDAAAASTGRADAVAPEERSRSVERTLLRQQQEVFLGAALVAAHDYEGAKHALGAVRDGLRDSYAVFHTNNIRVKLEWSSIFQQLSDLEEGIHALEQAAAVREDGTAGTAAVVASSESETTGFAVSGPGSPLLEREVHGRVLPEVTIRRLRNIVCRPLSATTSPLQRFMMIATRSAIAPVGWQVENIVTLCEMLEKGGQPMRAVEHLHRYAQQSASAGQAGCAAATEHTEQLRLETLRRIMRNLPEEENLREMYACLQTALRQDLWQSRRAAAAAARGGQTAAGAAAASTSGASFSFMWGPNGAVTSSGVMDPLLAVISDVKRRRSPVLDSEELGPTLSSYQVDLLLLSVACRRRLAHVLLRAAPLTQRMATGGVRNHRSDAPSSASSAAAVFSSLPAGVAQPLQPGTSSCGDGGEISGQQHASPAVVLVAVGTPEGGSRIGADTSAGTWPTQQQQHLSGHSVEAHDPHMPLDTAAVATASPSTARSVTVSTGTPLERDALSGGSTRHTSSASGGTSGDGGGGGGEASGTGRTMSGAGERSGVLHHAAGDGAGDSAAASAVDDLIDDSALFEEYYLLEHAVTVTHYVPSVWREFGLVLFDICLAIHSEWKTTGDEDTRLNFLAQSAKAIHGLQLASQLWESGSASALGKGLGPFPAMAQRRHRHARTALPSAHLLLKALHLAVACELLVQEEAQTAPASSGGCGGVGRGAAESVARGNSGRSPSPCAAAESAAHHDGENSAHNLDTVSPSTASASTSCSHHTLQPCGEDNDEDEDETGGGGNGHSSSGPRTHPRPPTARRISSASPASTPQRKAKDGASGAAAAATPAAAAASPAATARPPSGGFSCLDFSAASYGQWAAIAPLLVAAATRHPTLYAVVRDMCVRSRHMLRQLVFTLVANFEHTQQTLFVQRMDQMARGRGVAGTLPVSGFNHAAESAAAAASPFYTQSHSLTNTTSGVGGQRGVGSFGRRVTSVPELWEEAGSGSGVTQPDSNNSSSGSSSSSSSSSAEETSLREGGAAIAARRQLKRRRDGAGHSGGAIASNDTMFGTDTAITDVEGGSSSTSAADAASPPSTATLDGEDGYATASVPEEGDRGGAVRLSAPTDTANLMRRPTWRCERGGGIAAGHHQQPVASRTRTHSTPSAQPAQLDGLHAPPREEVTVRSLLLADVAAASPSHYRHVHEAMQLRSFMQHAWDTETTYTAALSPLTDILSSSAPNTTATDTATAVPTPQKRARGDSRAAEPPSLPPLDTDTGFVPVEADGTLKAMELVLGGHCPLPVPLWLLSGVFGTMTSVDEDDSATPAPSASRGGTDQASRTSATAAAAGGSGGVRATANRGGSSSVSAGAGNARRGDGEAWRDAGGDAAGKSGARGTDRMPSSSLSAGAAAAAAAAGGTAAATAGVSGRSSTTTAPRTAVPFSPSTVPGVVHVRRFLVPHPAPHHRKEEIIFVMLSDGALCRLRHVAAAPARATLPQPSTLGAGSRNSSSSGNHALYSGKSGGTLPNTEGGEVRYIAPHSLMEQVTSLLLSHLPLTNLQRPFVLPLGLQDYITMLPEQTSGFLFGATVTAAVLHATTSQGWKSDAALLSGEASAAANITSSLLSPSSTPTSARSTPSLHHLMDDYTVHLRVREMASAAHEAVAQYPTSDVEATYIAAETGRGAGAAADNSFPFNWAYGYPASAPPSDTAMSAALSSADYRDVVRQRKMREARFDQLVATAYNKGNVEQLVTYVRELLAAHPMPPSTRHTSTAAESADGVYAQQQRLYAYLATLPRTETHLRTLLEALEEAMGECITSAPSATTTTNTVSVRQRGASPRTTSTDTVAVPAASPQVDKAVPRTSDSSSGSRPPGKTVSLPTSPPRAIGGSAAGAPLVLTADVWQACRLALLRVESSRCRSALAEAFSADSSDATHWLDVRRTYAKELAEWSVVQYLFDTHGRECGDVLVNTYDGHVAMHAVGRCSLQPPCRGAEGFGIVCDAATGETREGETAKLSAAAAAGGALKSHEADPLTSAPFPTRDPTLFRLTPVLQAGLPMQSPYAFFQYRAAAVLHDIYTYVRDLTGITSYGVDLVTAFVYSPSQAAHAAVASGQYSSKPLPVHQRRETQWAAAKAEPSVQEVTTAATANAERTPLATPPLHPNAPAESEAGARQLSEVSQPHSFPDAPAPARTSAGTTVAAVEGRRLPRASSVASITGVTEMPASSATINPVAAARLLSVSSPAAAATPGVGGGGEESAGRGWAGESRHADGRRSSRDAMPSLHSTREGGCATNAAITTTAAAASHNVAFSVHDAPTPLPRPPRCFNASSLRLKLSYDILLVLHADAEQEGRAALLRIFRQEREATEESWPRQPALSASASTPAEVKERDAVGDAAMMDGAEEDAEAHATGASSGSAAAPRSAASTTTTSQSAYDLMARLIVAATSEVKLTVVDDVTPHLWRRWAPHW